MKDFSNFVKFYEFLKSFKWILQIFDILSNFKRIFQIFRNIIEFLKRLWWIFIYLFIFWDFDEFLKFYKIFSSSKFNEGVSTPQWQEKLHNKLNLQILQTNFQQNVIVMITNLTSKHELI